MNKVYPILTCDCCAGSGLIRTCKLKNCKYKMCRSCSYKHYIKQNNKKCPACRRNIYENNCCYSYPKRIFIKMKQKFINHNILCTFNNNFQTCIFKYCNRNMFENYISVILTIFIIFVYSCIFRFIYQIHCPIIFPSFCSEPFFSDYFVLLTFLGLFIVFVYYLIYLFIRACSNIYNEYEDF